MPYTREQLIYVTTHAGNDTDANVGAACGLTRRQVEHLRTRFGLTAKVEKINPVWTPDKVAQAHELYIVQGVAGPTAAKALGVTERALRDKSRKMGWVRDPSHAVRNRNSAVKATKTVSAERANKRGFDPVESAAIASYFAKPERAPEPIPVKRGRQLARSARLVDIGGGVQVIRLRPVTDRIVQHCAPQARRGASIEDLAELFEVAPESLRHKLLAAGVEVAA